MRANLFFFPLFLIFFLIVSCERRTGDRIEQEILYADAMIYNANQPLLNHPDSVILCLNEAQSKCSDSIVWHYNESHKSYAYFYDNKMDSALIANRHVRAFIHQSTPSYWLRFLECVNSNYRGVMMMYINERDSAINYFLEASHAAEATGKYDKLVNVCINLGDTYRQIGKLPEASHWYRRGLLVADSLNYLDDNHSIYMGLGQIYTDLENYPLAQSYFEKVDSLYPPKTPYERYFYYNTRGNSYFFDKKYPEALACFQNAYAITQQFKNPFMNAIVEGNIGEVNLMAGALDSAKHYINSSYNYFITSSNTDDAILFYVNGLKSALALAENNLKEAEYYLNQPYNAERIGPGYLYIYHKRLQDFYRRKGDYKRAFEYQDKVTLYNDSLRNVNQQNRITEVEFRHRQDTTLLKRDIVIARNRTQISRLRFTIIGGAVLLLAIIIAIIALLRYHKQKQERLRRQQMEIITKLRMENVRNRFSPHFVFNVLNLVISSLRQNKQVMEPMKLLVQILRSNLLVCDKTAIALCEEVEMVQNFVMLRMCMNPTTPKVEWKIDKNVDKHVLIPVMCIQIPIENAIKHAFPDDENIQSPMIDVSITKLDKDYFKINITDNGIGYGRGQMRINPNRNDSTGTGIRILYRTIELLNKKNSLPISFDIRDITASQNQLSGTEVTILIPQKYNYDV